MEGGTAMGETSGGVEGNFHVNKFHRFWGLRPWKRHSLILLVVGFVYGMVGFQYIFSEPSKGREIALEMVLRLAPMEFWGSIFVVTGLLTVISARWPPFAETWGYMVLTGLSTGWSGTYLMGILVFNSPTTNYTQVLLWGCLAFIWWAVSGLLNPDSTTAATHEKL